MRDRYKEPPCFDAPPHVEQLPDILRDAMLTDDEVAEDNEGEARRRESIDALLRFARAELTKARAEAARATAQLAEALAHQGLAKDVAQGVAKAMLAPALGPLTGFEDFERNPRHYAWTFLAEAWLRILTAEDPVAELTLFLGRKRGRPAHNGWRDLMITIDIQEKVDSGSSVKDACAVISADINLSPDAVEKIYYALRQAPGVQDQRVREQFLDYAQSSERK